MTSSPAVPVLVTSRSFSSGDLDLAGELAAAGCTLLTGPPDHDLETLRPQLADAVTWIAGTGPITGERLAAAPSTVIVHAPWLDAATFERLGVRAVTLDELAAASDIVTLHAPGDRVIINQEFLCRLRPDSILINTARASLIDEGAVAATRRSGRLAIYASDVLSTESGGPECPLLADDLADRTIFTPHTAAQTVEADGTRCRGRRVGRAEW